MSESMYEITSETDLTGIRPAFPNVRKVTVDMANKTLYVFVGRSARANVVTGDEFDKLVKTLPGKGGPSGKSAKSNQAAKGDKSTEGKPEADASIDEDSPEGKSTAKGKES